MIIDHLETENTHINTVMSKNLIHFQNLNCMSYTMQYKIKLVNTSTVKLVNIFKDKKYFGELDKKLQSFVIDWGDGISTKIFTEYVNTNSYNSSSNLRLIHHYTVPMNTEIIITIMSENETLVPVPYDESLTGIEVYAMGGEFAANHKPFVTTLHPILQKYLTEVYSLRKYTNRTLLQSYSGDKLYSLFGGCTKLVSVYSDILLYGCEKVEDMYALFGNCEKLSYVPNGLLERTPRLKYISLMFNGCKSIRSIGRIFANKQIEVMYATFEGCELLNYIHPDNFINKKNLNICNVFNGCKTFTRALTLRLFEGSTFTKEGLRNSFANINNLDNSNPNDLNVFVDQLYDFRYMFGWTTFSTKDVVPNKMTVTDGEGFMYLPVKTDDIYEKFPDDTITLKPDDLGGVNIRKMFSNRTIEIMSKPFKIGDDISRISYDEVFLGSKSLYNDQQIFGRCYNSSMNSGLEMIYATMTYKVTTLKPDTVVHVVSAHNIYNPDFEVELGADAYLNTGYNNEIIHLTPDSNSDGFTEVLYKYPGTYTIEVKYTHCAPPCVTYKNEVDRDNYIIEAADLELFPMETPYTGLYGCELWCAESITGDLFKLFYDTENNDVYKWKTNPNVWMDNMFAYFDGSVRSVSDDIFRSVHYLGNITELNNLFRYSYNLDSGRNIFISEEEYSKVVPLSTFGGEIFRYTPNVNIVSTWFNDVSEDNLVDISNLSLNNLFTSIPKIKVIDKVLHGCKLFVTDDAHKIKWDVHDDIEEIESYIGNVNYLDTTLLTKSKLKRVNRFHLTPMQNGADEIDLMDIRMDFEGSVDDIDLTDMFIGEHFEIPNGFIRNVRGTLRYNNCFRGSYRVDINDEEMLFDNVPNKSPRDETGIEFLSLSEPLCVQFENFTETTGSIKLKLKDKVKTTDNRVLLRIYRQNNTDKKLIYTALDGMSDTFTIPSLYTHEGTDEIRMEIWCSTANIYIEQLERMSVKTLSGVFGSTHWVDKVRMQSAYPGLVPSNIICTDDGGPWRNILPINGIIDFTDMFTGVVNKELIDYRILKTNSPDGTVYKLNGLFKDSSIAEFDIRMFEFIGDVLIEGQYLFRNNSDENFNFINLISGPYIFMELLFTKFKTARYMFAYSAVPRKLFNHAPFFGCDRNGDELSYDVMIPVDLQALVYRWNSTTHANNVPEEYAPYFKPGKKLKLASNISLRDILVSTKYLYNPEVNYAILPESDTVYEAWATLRSENSSSVTYIDDVVLGSANIINRPFNIMGKCYFNKDYRFIKTYLRDTSITTSPLFTKTVSIEDSRFKFLIEPFSSDFENIDLSLGGDTFKDIETYAPPEVLFRNVRSYTGTGGVKVLTYPNEIVYQNIHITGNQLTFIREELNINHRFTTYLTVHIMYTNSYDEAEWIIVDKGSDQCTIDIDSSRVVNNTITVKIQSTQCFYLTKTNVDYVEKLDGTYRKDLQPRDSEFFNFDVDYYYFIENFGANLWKDVKIKQGTKFKFGSFNSANNRLKSIEGTPFKNQSHISEIRYLFSRCKNFTPTEQLLIGFENVLDADNLFYDSIVSKDIVGRLLDPLVSVTDLSYVFSFSENITNIPNNLFLHATKLTTLRETFAESSIRPDVILSVDFWSSISSTCNEFYKMFYNTIGLSRTDNICIEDRSFIFNDSTKAAYMFAGTNILDVKTSWIKEGSLNNSSSTDMFASCYTYDDPEVFKSKYGSNTGVVHKCHESMTYRSSSANISGKFKFIDTELCPNKEVEYVKIVVDNGTYYRTIAELEERGITVNTNFVKVFSDYAIILESDNVERLEGVFPSKSGKVSSEDFKLGVKYPKLTYIDSTLFGKLTEQTSMNEVFAELTDITIIHPKLFAPLTKLTNVSGLYMNAGGVLNTLMDIRYFVGYSEIIEDYANLFKNVQIKQIQTGSIYIYNDVVNVAGMFSGSEAYIDKTPFVGVPISFIVTDTFSSCKSLYTDDELIVMNKTGIANVTTLNSFRPTVSFSSDIHEVNLAILHDNPDRSMKVDTLVDWGDGNTSVILNNEVGSSVHLSRHIRNGSELRIWSSYYALGVKRNALDVCADVVSLGGSIGKVIDSNPGFISKYFPNATSISSEFNLELDPSVVISKMCENSKIESLPAGFLRRKEEPINTDFYWSFSNMLSLQRINFNFFDGISSSAGTSMSIAELFYNTPQLSSSYFDMELMFSKITSLNQSGVWNRTFKNTGIIPSYETLKAILTKFNGPSITLTEGMYGSKVNNVGKMFEALTERNITCNYFTSCFENGSVTVDIAPLISTELFNSSSIVHMANLFKNTMINGVNSNGLSSMNVQIIDKYMAGLRIDITDSLIGIRSIYTESEMFAENTTIGSSGLTTNPRTSMSMQVTSGTLKLKPKVNSDYNRKVLIKKNGVVHELTSYSNLTLNVEDNDIIDIITFDDIKDAYMEVDLVSSTSKVTGLSGVFNVGPKSIVNGSLYKTISEIYGTDIVSISDTFFKQFNTITSASNLMRSLTNLKQIPNKLLEPMIEVIDWSSMFEGCTSLNLTDDNSEMFIIANKGVSFDYMFKNTGVTYIPPRFFKGCKELNKTFTGTFMLCNLQFIPNDIGEY